MYTHTSTKPKTLAAIGGSNEHHRPVQYRVSVAHVPVMLEITCACEAVLRDVAPEMTTYLALLQTLWLTSEHGEPVGVDAQSERSR